ncbi:isoprenoid biosynthesis glyoxalase ElbB [Chlorobium sp. BLA1]|uniref:isoprenoid biosynthesis glyoxalase ElbB n=1 Tax=Candidatus Chlorobium masyuteum TaxID=2716876 RepID=UPI001422B3F6|nr:isoprenoid biosynthesis glyoxalase ElbB [Candidatus Chlorobium masyuteum]NHQ59163.1 isoprenoid biosynthesis glyoxalase ElbB [Candidatus Chlorobium masyuteum]
MKKIGVLLSGCGYLDGSEIHEAVLTLLAIDNAGAKAQCLAPNIPQHHVVNHLTGEAVPSESRNVLVEAARIARGAITDLSNIDTLDLDALILVGGYGAGKNLCTYAFKGSDCDVIPEVSKILHAFFKAGKPLGFICITPVIAAKVLGDQQIELTSGCDQETADNLEAMGARHIECTASNTIVSNKGKIVSTPAYMLETSIAEVSKGIDKLVTEIIAML